MISYMSCVKKKFSSKKDAEQRIERIANSYSESGKKPVRCYLCDKCHKFHLTSISKNLHKWIEKTKARRNEIRLNREVAFWLKKLSPKCKGDQIRCSRKKVKQMLLA